MHRNEKVDADATDGIHTKNNISAIPEMQNNIWFSSVRNLLGSICIICTFGRVKFSLAKFFGLFLFYLCIPNFAIPTTLLIYFYPLSAGVLNIIFTFSKKAFNETSKLFKTLSITQIQSNFNG